MSNFALCVVFKIFVHRQTPLSRFAKPLVDVDYHCVNWAVIAPLQCRSALELDVFALAYQHLRRIEILDNSRCVDIACVQQSNTDYLYYHIRAAIRAVLEMKWKLIRMKLQIDWLDLEDENKDNWKDGKGKWRMDAATRLNSEDFVEIHLLWSDWLIE